MASVSSTSTSNNNNLYFSKSELGKILNCYSTGVSNGNWKDYSLNFNYNEAVFSFYKNTYSSPDCILKKILEKKKKKVFFHLMIKNKNRSKYENIDSLLALIKRRQIAVM